MAGVANLCRELLQPQRAPRLLRRQRGRRARGAKAAVQPVPRPRPHPAAAALSALLITWVDGGALLAHLLWGCSGYLRNSLEPLMQGVQGVGMRKSNLGRPEGSGVPRRVSRHCAARGSAPLLGNGGAGRVDERRNRKEGIGATFFTHGGCPSINHQPAHSPHRGPTTTLRLQGCRCGGRGLAPVRVGRAVQERVLPPGPP